MFCGCPGFFFCIQSGRGARIFLVDSTRQVYYVDSMTTDTGRYGPQTPEIETLLATAGTLTEEQLTALDVAETKCAFDAWRPGRTVAQCAAQDAARSVAMFAARGAALDVAGYAGIDAVTALVVRDLIDPHGFTQVHYDLLTGPWRQVVGLVHPDDKELAS